MKRSLPLLFTLAFACLAAPKATASQTVSLAWDRSPEPDVAGYRVLYGTTSGALTQTLDAGGQTKASVANLASGMTYFFAVTAYNSAALESAPSNEVSYSAPAAVPSPTPTTPTPTPRPEPTASPTPTAQPTPNPTASPTPEPTASPTPSSSPSPKPVPTTTPSPEPTATPTPEPSAGPKATPRPLSALSNVSTRAQVGVGENVAIGGFIITGQENKEIVIRAVGPSLESAGVTGAMADPMIELYDATGAVLAWSGDSQAQRAELEAAGLAMADAREAALTTSLPPGAYTVVLSGEDGGTGVALFELYDRHPNGSRIAAISTRGTVGGGEDVVIGGFILGGDQPTQVVVRAIGASLTPLGAANALADPYLEVYDGEGSLMFANDDWRTDQEQQLIECLLPPQDEHESAIIATLRPGNYSAVVRGVGGTSGVALVEVYNLTP